MDIKIRVEKSRRQSVEQYYGILSGKFYYEKCELVDSNLKYCSDTRRGTTFNSFSFYLRYNYTSCYITVYFKHPDLTGIVSCTSYALVSDQFSHVSNLAP